MSVHLEKFMRKTTKNTRKAKPIKVDAPFEPKVSVDYASPAQPSISQALVPPSPYSAKHNPIDISLTVTPETLAFSFSYTGNLSETK